MGLQASGSRLRKLNKLAGGGGGGDTPFMGTGFRFLPRRTHPYTDPARTRAQDACGGLGGKIIQQVLEHDAI